MLNHENKAFTCDQIDKIGNTIIYLSKHIPELNKTKILKFLFILEESSIKKYGKPFFGIDFQLWKYGPVAKDIYIDLTSSIPTDSPNLLKDYIDRHPDNSEQFVAKKQFIDDEFSDNDIALLDQVIEFAKDKNASYLVQQTHGSNSLWRQSALKYGVLELLENELVNSTDYIIDFSLLFQEDSIDLQHYLECKENLSFSCHLKY
ncbi:Panacea domain-containing protein [Gynurincola endophyticus]|uniref:Panacea domain-containing protein n=1 Tax=Gynurincola endophyticus TaxID=2479004 RepID=UPI000F8E3201|nr:Panacea domain-containing protein [Gynurincola endophyticus]